MHMSNLSSIYINNIIDFFVVIKIIKYTIATEIQYSVYYHCIYYWTSIGLQLVLVRISNSNTSTTTNIKYYY